MVVIYIIADTLYWKRLQQKVSYRTVIDKVWPDTPSISLIERFEFYERTKQAFCVVMTGETAKYGNIILKKGVTPVE